MIPMASGASGLSLLAWLPAPGVIRAWGQWLRAGDSGSGQGDSGWVESPVRASSRTWLGFGLAGVRVPHPPRNVQALGRAVPAAVGQASHGDAAK